MPYTLLHPGFATTLYRRWPKIFSMAGLIIGSIVPDLDIIYRFSETRFHIFTYTFTNIITVLVPISMVMYVYLKWLWIPISSHGTFDLNVTAFKKIIAQFPKIIFSILTGIYLHLFLDNYAHFDDTTTLATQIKNNLGYETQELSHLEIFLIYLPQIIISGIGLLFTIYYIVIYRKNIQHHIKYLLLNKRTSSFIFFIVLISFTSMKIIKAGIENYLKMDSLIIGFTCGLVSAIILTPFLVFVFKKISSISKEVFFLLIWMFTLYNFGLPKKEYLSIYIIKEVLVLILAISIYLLFKKYFQQKKYLSLKEIFFLSMPLALISNIAYYISFKGLGPGVLVISFISLLLIYQYSAQKNYYQIAIYLDKIAALILITNANPTLGIVSTIITLLLIVYNILQKSTIHKKLNFIFYIILLPIISVIYIADTYSKLYGLFCLSQYLIAWLFIFSNYFVTEDSEEKYPATI